MSRKFIIIAIIVLTASMIFLLRPRAGKQYYPPFRVNNPAIELKPYSSKTLRNNIYRILAQGDSLVVMAEGLDYQVFNMDLSSSRQIATTEKLYDIFISPYRQFGVSLEKSAVFALDHAAGVQLKTIPNLIGSSILSGDHLTFISSTPSTDGTDSVSLKSTPLDADSVSEIINFNELFSKQLLLKEFKCLTGMTEGNFFRLQDGRIGYLFYFGGYFLLFNNSGQVKLYQTVGKKPFKKFITRKIFSGSDEIISCQPEDDKFVSLQAAANNKYLFVLPAEMKNEDDRAIAYLDLYDLKSIDYKYSISIPVDKTGYVSQLAVSGDLIYLVFNEKELRAFKFSELEN